MEYIDRIPSEADDSISDTFQILFTDGTLWITFIKGDGYEHLPNYGSWRYTFVPDNGEMPSTDGGFGTPLEAFDDWDDMQANQIDSD